MKARLPRTLSKQMTHRNNSRCLIDWRPALLIHVKGFGCCRGTGCALKPLGKCPACCNGAISDGAAVNKQCRSVTAHGGSFVGRLPRILAMLLAVATLVVAMAGGRRVAGGDDAGTTLNELIAGASLPEAWWVVERLRGNR